MKPPYLINEGSPAFSPMVPAGWSGTLLPGASPLWYTGVEGSILIQELKAPQFSLRYFVFRFLQKVVLKSRNENGLQSLLLLKGSLHQKINGLPAFELNKNQFLLFRDPGSEMISTFTSGKECHLLATCYTPEFYREWLGLFPQLQPPAKRSKKPLLLQPKALPVRTTVLDAIREQFFESYQPILQDTYHGLKIKNNLFTLLAQSSEPPVDKQLTAFQKEAVRRVHDTILQDLSVHYSNTRLAEVAGINKTDLKRFFRQYYGLGMFELLQRERFQKARTLLQEGRLNIKQIAPLVGYPHTTTFITEFRKYFGYTPLDVQSGRKGR